MSTDGWADPHSESEQAMLMKDAAFGRDHSADVIVLYNALMRLLCDACWWAPEWLKRIQRRVGLSESTLDGEPPGQGA